MAITPESQSGEGEAELNPHFNVAFFTKDRRLIETAVEVLEVARIINEIRAAEYQHEEPRFAFQYEKNPDETFFCTTMVHLWRPDMFPFVTNDPQGN